MSLFSALFSAFVKEAFWECAWERRHCEATGNLVIVTRSRTAEETTAREQPTGCFAVLPPFPDSVDGALSFPRWHIRNTL